MSHDNSNSNVHRCGQCGQIGEEDDDHVSVIDDWDKEYADAVLGDGDEYNCSYPKGYLKRQALYACATCTPSGNAGICLACSYTCHEGHDIFELYTKRAFRCDCGNEKFKGNQCQLYKDQKELNSRNRYNQNFVGLYCTCSSLYLDADDPVIDVMIQCIMCEDWYHGRHLETTVPNRDDYHEMICSGCMCKFSFLWAYHAQSAALVSVSDTSSSSPGKRKLSDTNGNEVSASKKARCCDEQPHTSSATSNCMGSSEGHQCLLKSLQQRVLNYPEHAAFLSEGWRSKLCRCPQCLDMFHDRGIDYLLDDTDTLHAYEERGMDRVQQIKVVKAMTCKTNMRDCSKRKYREKRRSDQAASSKKTPRDTSGNLEPLSLNPEVSDDVDNWKDDSSSVVEATAVSEEPGPSSAVPQLNAQRRAEKRKSQAKEASIDNEIVRALQEPPMTEIEHFFKSMVPTISAFDGLTKMEFQRDVQDLVIRYTRRQRNPSGQHVGN